MIYKTLTIKQALERKAIQIVGKDALKSMIKLKLKKRKNYQNETNRRQDWWMLQNQLNPFWKKYEAS